MIVQEIRWTPPSPERYFRWDGRSFDELEALINTEYGARWTVTPEGTEGAVRLQGSIGGEDFVLNPGDYFQYVGDPFPIGPDLPGLPYPSEWLS